MKESVLSGGGDCHRQARRTTTVQELIGRRLGVLALVIVNEVLDVSLMFLLEVAGPESSSDNYSNERRLIGGCKP